MMIETIGSPNEPTRRFGGRIPGTFRKCDDEMFGEDRMIDLLQCGEFAFCCKNRACVVLVCYGACVEKTVCYVFFWENDVAIWTCSSKEYWVCGKNNTQSETITARWSFDVWFFAVRAEVSGKSCLQHVALEMLIQFSFCGFNEKKGVFRGSWCQTFSGKTWCFLYAKYQLLSPNSLLGN